jgi:hypothetical protein
MKPLILIGCLVCLCIKADQIPDTYVDDFTGHPKKTEAPKIEWIDAVVATNLICITNRAWFGFCSTNYATNSLISYWDRTNIIIPDYYKGTIQVGNKFYHIDSYTNVQSKIVSVTNVTRVLTTEIIK